MQDSTTQTLGLSSSQDAGQAPTKNRRQRRAEKARLKKLGVREGVADVKLEELRKAVQAWSAQMSQQVEGMRQAFNQNHLAYSQALNHVDAKLNVIQAVINDVYGKSPKLDAEGHIDWSAYLQEYQEYLQELARKQQETKQAAEEVSGEIVKELQEEVFGGDYGTGSQTGGDREVSELGGEPTSEIAAGDGQGGTGIDSLEGADSDEVPEVPRDDGADSSG